MKSSQRLCESCGKRPAKYWSAKRKAIASKKDHSLCSSCYSKLLNSTRRKP